ncbi:DEAD/DEAH box helicase [Cohnella sp. 56]|uniref:DEAD/DEAH box helicase n=1 Tax=Cohnella sp. 56 TaxID=3113722 RepID=UPI0030EABD62
MSAQLTRQNVKLLCGKLAFESGEAYARAGKVTFTRYAPASGEYEATVAGGGKGSYDASIRLSPAGDISASCTCPSLASYAKYCNHIAAALLKLMDYRRANRAPDIAGAGSQDGPGAYTAADHTSDEALAARMIGLFEDRPPARSGARQRFETRDRLTAEFVCRAIDDRDGRRSLGLELRIGLGARTYAVRRIGGWLDSVARGQSHAIGPTFVYDPERHCFAEADDAVVQALIRIHRGDLTSARPAFAPGSGPGSSSAGSERLLPLPPAAWETLHPLLAAAPVVYLEAGDRVLPGVPLSDGPLPVRYEVDFDPDGGGGCTLGVQGLDALVVLEAHGLALTGSGLIKLPPAACERLARLKQLLPASGDGTMRIPKTQTSDFMERVVPGLLKLGSVRIASAVSEAIVQEPLAAKLYLDRVRDRLLAGLEFHYGGVTINPLEDASARRAGGEDRILVRDSERERRILDLMDGSAFVRTESGYVMSDEEGEFEFLHRIVPLLEPLLSVYATSAVRVRLLPEPVVAKISADRDERTDWLTFKFDISGIPEAEIRALLKSLEEKRAYYRMASGAFVPLDGRDFAEINRLLAATGMLPSELKDGMLRLPLVRGLHLLDREDGVVKQSRRLRELVDNLRHPDQLDFAVPAELSGTLRDYQLYGYQWMRTLAYYRFGGILADDMGLGKTVQTIAFLTSMLPVMRERGQPALIVCPASLMYNWLSELRRFAPGMRVRIADGARQERAETLAALAGVDAVIVSYPLLRRDIQQYAGIAFHTLILDEAQAVKNESTQTAQAARRIAADYRFALTGTPIENALDELRSIAAAVFPGLFPGRRAFSELSREEVSDRIRPFVLRRLKSDVLRELPDKIESVIASELLPAQKKLYAAYLAKLRSEALKHLDKETFNRNRIQILAGITRLRQLCCHPALFVEGYAGGSAKLEQLLELLEDCRAAGRRALVFSQFTSMLALIRRELGARGVTHFYLDGDTPAAERVALCDRFNAGERELFLASLKAGGTGLNLTGADTVILYDLWWNPAVEQQAADRVHRIGQQRAVQVIRLVAQGTVEDKMAELQQRKLHLIDEVIQPGQEALSALTEQDIRELLSIGQA